MAVIATKSGALTIDEIETDRITKFGKQYWIRRSVDDVDFRSEVVDIIYKEELLSSRFSHKRVLMLEFSQYLEHYLWPFYTEIASDEHVLSVVCLINAKFRERVPAWPAMQRSPLYLSHFLHRVMTMSLERTRASQELLQLVNFLDHCYTSLEVDVLRERLRRTLSLGMWAWILPSRREKELLKHEKYNRQWRVLLKRETKLQCEERVVEEQERAFLVHFLDAFLERVEAMNKVAEGEDLSVMQVRLCEHSLQLLVDLMSTLLTRRFFSLVLMDRHTLVRCRLSSLYKRPEGKLFGQLLEMLRFYAHFEMDEVNGEALSASQVDAIHCRAIVRLQRAAYRLGFHEEGLSRFCVSHIAHIEREDGLRRHLEQLPEEKLGQLAAALNLVPSIHEASELDIQNKHRCSTVIPPLIEVLLETHVKRQSQLDLINSLPLYPTETIIWDENLVPSEFYSGDACLALPKLNLQFLTLHDYLARNFHLFRLESTYEIREDLQDSLLRMKPWCSENGEHVFGGWSRMALPIQSFSVIEVAKPLLGKSQPSRVRADVQVALTVRREVASEWDQLRRHDPCFLVTVRPRVPYGNRVEVSTLGVVYVRGCELEGLLDDEGRVIPEDQAGRVFPSGSLRTFRVRLDPCQYQEDMEATTSQKREDVYETFNVLVRRKPKENNFKAVLETIRDLMNTRCVVPEWLHELLLGYEDPTSGHYTRRKEYFSTYGDWYDTFLDRDHLLASFPHYRIRFTNDLPKPNVIDGKDLCVNTPPDLIALQKPPYRLLFPVPKGDELLGMSPDQFDCGSRGELLVEPYHLPRISPYQSKATPQRYNQVRFTPTQVEAIHSGMQSGLTLVVGPPGSGKTDVAVQIIANLYRNNPNQRILIVTHSNQALNQLFEKIVALNVDERHLLRLGHGEEALATDKDFSRYGRVNYVLAKRLELLDEVGRLAESLGMARDLAASCETAEFFYLYHVLSRWEKFQEQVSLNPAALASIFPFAPFFGDSIPSSLTLTTDNQMHWTEVEQMEAAETCYRYIQSLFSQLNEFRAFEHMRSGVERANYLLVQEAKIVAMTCTHAALKRRDLVDLGFQYDTILMEEAAQILEIETFIPLLLQNPDLQGRNRLKRWIMIGDHHQLPPVIKNMSFQKYSNMEQSLFARLIKLGVPSVELDAQGRARSSLAQLYRWRYRRLDDLPHVVTRPSFQKANPGLVYDYQIINVMDYNGVGESTPSPHFFQNLAEAEFATALFMYMRLQGYPAQSITILSTYNGQKHLIRDVLRGRCANNPLIGWPAKVTTVDRYQGQQNDYVILSLVRTRAVGHLRDVRRLVVALSRARLGLYVLGRVSLFRQCFELRPAMQLLCQRPQRLALAPWELYSTNGSASLLRNSEDALQQEPLIVRGMPHLCQFVYDLYNRRLEQLLHRQRHQAAVAQAEALGKALPLPPKEDKSQPDEVDESLEATGYCWNDLRGNGSMRVVVPAVDAVERGTQYQIPLPPPLSTPKSNSCKMPSLETIFSLDAAGAEGYDLHLENIKESQSVTNSRFEHVSVIGYEKCSVFDELIVKPNAAIVSSYEVNKALIVESKVSSEVGSENSAQAESVLTANSNYKNLDMEVNNLISYSETVSENNEKDEHVVKDDSDDCNGGNLIISQSNVEIDRHEQTFIDNNIPSHMDQEDFVIHKLEGSADGEGISQCDREDLIKIHQDFELPCHKVMEKAVFDVDQADSIHEQNVQVNIANDEDQEKSFFNRESDVDNTQKNETTMDEPVPKRRRGRSARK